MKTTLKYIIIAALAPVLLAGCRKDDNVFGEQNRGKERPVVTITEVGVTAVEENGFISVSGTFTLTASEDSYTFGYAVMDSTDGEAPDAYSILVEEVESTLSSRVEFYEGKAGTYSFSATVADDEFTDYRIYAAAMTRTGLTSNVAEAVIKADDVYAAIDM